MTLDQAIKHAEEVAEEQRSYAHKCEGIIVVNQTIKKYREELINRYIECADEHLQLAEWLRELKEYRKQKNILDKIKEEVKLLSNANPSYWHSGDMVEREEVLAIIDKYKESEVKE